MSLDQQFGYLYSTMLPFIVYFFSIFSHFSLQRVPLVMLSSKFVPHIRHFEICHTTIITWTQLVRFPFHGYSNHIHNHCFEQTREQMKLVQNNTTLIYYNRYSILQPRYAYYCLQLQHIICYSLLICFTASDMDSHFTCAKNKNEHIRIRIGT